MDPFIATPAMARVVSSGWPCALHAGACRPYGAQAPALVRPPPIHGPFPLWPVPCPGIFCAGGSFVVQCEPDPDRALAPPLPALSPGSRNGAMRNGLHATSACTDMVLPDHPPPAGTFGPWPSRPAVQPSGFLSRHAAQCLHPSRLRKGAGDLHGLPHARNAGSHHVRQPGRSFPTGFIRRAARPVSPGGPMIRRLAITALRLSNLPSFRVSAPPALARGAAPINPHRLSYVPVRAEGPAHLETDRHCAKPRHRSRQPSAQAGADVRHPEAQGPQRRPDFRRRRAGSAARRLRLPAHARNVVSGQSGRHLHLALADPALQPAHR